jgi:photosystem II stability/assembly factor-like uncharacterized protein
MYVVPEISPERRYVSDAALGIYRTPDGGKSWRKLSKGLPQKNVYTQVLRHAAASDQAEDAGIYVGTTGGSIFYSRNNGDSWQVLADNLAPIMALHAALI